MEAFAVSAVLVAIAEMGDKTQLLALVLAARLRRPWPIVAGIAVATLANHALAGALGHFAGDAIPRGALLWGVGAVFIAFGLWALVPDRLDEGGAPLRFAGAGTGAFTVTLVAFFLVEMGDKTQLATVALAARYQALAAVVAGTTLGMLAANAPAVWLGEKLCTALPMKALRLIAAGLFIGVGVLTLWGAWLRGQA